MRENPNVKTDQLISHIRRVCGVDVSKWKAIRAKKYALQSIIGVDSVQYEILRDYCETVLKYNPGSRIIIKTRENCVAPTFGKLYYSLSGLKMNFLTSCRPIIGLDGCFFKTVHGGQLLAAIGRDGNDGMVPIAIEIVEVENRETWTWFLSELLEDIGGLGENMWTFISDRQKGLIEALKDLVPDSEHRFCLRHMYQNFKKKFSSLELKDLFWKAATTGNKNEFNSVMNKMARVDPKVDDALETAHEWLLKVPPVHWARSHFTSHCKSDVLVNNISESFNSFILEDREKPIITMLEGIRTKLMRKTQEREAGMEKYPGKICPNILKKIEKCQDISRSCFSIYSGDLEYQVQYATAYGVVRQYVVNLRSKTCTCGLFQLCGYPCCHACAAIADSRQKIEDFVDICYTKVEYLKGYRHFIHAVPGEIDYCKSKTQPLNPPPFKRKRGRPKINRKKGADEDKGVSIRKGLTHRCSRCLELGHNRATCSKPINPKSKLYKATSNATGHDNVMHSLQASITYRPVKKNKTKHKNLNASTRAVSSMNGVAMTFATTTTVSVNADCVGNSMARAFGSPNDTSCQTTTTTSANADCVGNAKSRTNKTK